MTLKNLKNEYAIKQGFANWNELLKLCDDRYLNHYIDQVMKIYAMECLKLASDNVTTVHHKLQTRENIINAMHLTKHSITNENNLIK